MSGSTSQMLAKYRNFARYLGMAVQVFFVVCALSGVIALLAACIIPFLPASAFDLKAGSYHDVNLTFDGFFAYTVDITQTEAVNLKSIAVAGSILCSCILAGMAIIWRQIRLILRAVQENQPFAAENAKRLTIIGFLMLGGSIGVKFGLFLLADLAVRRLGLENASANFTVEPAMFVTGFLILVLAGVFHYGNILQQEYDATV